MKKILLIIALLITTFDLNAQNIGDNTIINYDGYSITYTVTSTDPAECGIIKVTNPATETSITFPSAVTIEGTEFIITSIKDWAASLCGNITSIEFEEDTQVRTLGQMCFANCNNLTSLEIPSSVTTIGIGVFYHTNIESIEISKNVTSIGYNTPNINTTKIIVEEGNPFYDSRENCNAIIETLTNTLIVGCKNTIIPNSVTSIERNAFTASGITSIDIPASVNTINDYVFSSCYNLNSITCHALYAPKTYEYTFSECPSDMTIYVPAAAVNDYQTAENWGKFNIVAMENSSSPLAVGDNITIDYINYSLKYTVTNVNPAECEVSHTNNMNTPATLIIPTTVMINGNSVAVTSIADLRYFNMTELYIPRSIKSINMVLYNELLTKVIFEEGSQLTTIDWSFWQCYNLTSLELPESLTSIESWSIGLCPKLTTLICHAETAPCANGSFNFYQLSSDMTIYVPEESIASYKAEEPWNKWRIIGMRKDHFIGEGNQRSYDLPFSLQYTNNYSYSQQIYTADEIPSDGKCLINSIAFKQSNNGNGTAYIKVYMKNTTKSSFETGNDWIDVNASNLVFDGPVTFDGIADSWMTINLENSFYYTGKNILLCIENHDGYFNNNHPEFYVYNTDDGTMRSLNYYSDHYDEGEEIWGGIDTHVNQIKFTQEFTDLDLTIDESSSNNYYETGISTIPVYNDFDNVLSQQLYTAEEISLIDCVIGKIGFKQANNVNATRKFKVYLTNTTLESFNGEEDMIPLNDSELVFDGEVTFKGNPGTWCFINLDKEFKYTGDNIVLSILDYTNEYINPYPEFYTYGNSNYNSLNRRIEFLNYDEENMTYIYNGMWTYTNVVKFARDYNHSITIGYGDEVSYYLPYITHQHIGHSQQIYTEEEIAYLNDTIKTIAFRQSNNAVTTRGFKIRMQNTTKSSFENTDDWVSTYDDDDLVYDGPVTFKGNAGGWTYINLTKPFYYTGNNIMVDVTDDTYQYSDEYPEFYVYTTDTERSLTKDVWPNNTTHMNKFVNQFKMGFSKTEIRTATPTNLYAEQNYLNVKLYWDEVSNAESYNIYKDGVFVENVKETYFEIYDLEVETTYCFSVSSINGEYESPRCEDVCTWAMDLPITAPEVYGEAIDEYSIMLSWDPVDNAISYNIYGFGTVFNITDTIYIVENLEPNTDYCFEVSTVRNNTEVRTPYEICVMTFDLPITTPENLVATAISTSEITLTWDEVENALNYNVYRDDEFIANVNETNYSANNLDYYTEYCFTVTAVRNEQESESSDSDCAKTFDLPITTPENLVATAISTSEITLTWNEVENALSYNIYQDNEFIANVTENNYSSNNLDYYTEYCFTVTAVRNEQESENSNSDCAKTFDLPITTPENLVATAISTSEITLTWNEVENALSYNVYQNNNFIANVNDNNYSVNNLDYYTEYCFTITAVRNEQESESSDSDCAKTFDLPITTPENLIATAISTSEITLTWDEVENALSYNVYQNNNFIANVNDNNYSVNNLDYYTEYCFSVTAVRNEQESENSNSDCAKTFDLPISTPENLVATATSTSEITLTWNEVENALSYNVYRNNEFIANVNDNNYSVNNLDYYTEYCFTVTAVRNEQESENSNSDCAKTFDLPITTPENLVATAISTSEITLTWDEVENALSYNVYQNNNFIANVNDNNYSVNNLDYYTEYCFTVTAVRNEQESENSNSDCAKTFDLPITTPENLVATAISTSEITLTWDEVENALSYNVYRDDEFIANVNETNYSANNLDYYTEYCFTVTAVRNEQESESSDSDCAKTFDLPITTPENLVVTAISTSEITLTWDEVENALSYNVYRDNEFIANVTENNYSDEELEYNTEYCYSVTAVRNEQESEFSEKVCIKTLGEGIEELTSSYRLYPNPAKDKMYIATEEYVEEISIYNVSGVLIHKEIDFNNKSIDVSEIVSGVYFIKIKTENETFVQKFIKE